VQKRDALRQKSAPRSRRKTGTKDELRRLPSFVAATRYCVIGQADNRPARSTRTWDFDTFLADGAPWFSSIRFVSVLSIEVSL